MWRENIIYLEVRSAQHTEKSKTISFTSENSDSIRYETQAESSREQNLIDDEAETWSSFENLILWALPGAYLMRWNKVIRKNLFRIFFERTNHISIILISHALFDDYSSQIHFLSFRIWSHAWMGKDRKRLRAHDTTAALGKKSQTTSKNWFN